MTERQRDDYAEISSLGAQMHLLFDRLTRRYGDVPLFQFRALELLGHLDPEALEPREMAQMLDIGSNYMTKILDRLEARALLERREHGADRRRRLVRITPAGVALWRDVAPRVRALEEQVMGSAFGAEEQVEFRRLCGNLRRALADTIIVTRPTRSGP